MCASSSCTNLKFREAAPCAPGLCCSLSRSHFCSLRLWGSWEFASKPLSTPSSPQIYSQSGFSNEPAPGHSFPRPPSALRTKPDPLDLAFKVPPTLPHQAFSSGTQTLPQSPQIPRTITSLPPPPPAFAGAILLLSGMPFPLLGLASVLLRGQGLVQSTEAVSWSGRRGPWPSPASAGPLPSFPGSSLGPEPHVPCLALVHPPWLQLPSDTCFTRSRPPACKGGSPLTIFQMEATKPPLLAWASAVAFKLVPGSHLPPPTVTRRCL